jgi:hypothetical protein
MPDRYHVHTALTPARFRRIGKFGSIDWREDCSRCTNCVKLRCCFDVYRHESLQNHDPIGAIQTLYECKACLSCVQGCTKGLLNLSINPEFLEMGDEYWKPDMILSTWNQSDSGTIPVSGAGYRGPFHGPDFDSIWTDMSEIVRPTRDGIHGREYISTSVDIGSKPMRLSFTPDGTMLTERSPMLEIQIPAILDVPAQPIRPLELAEARAVAAKELRTVATVFAREFSHLPPDLLPYSVPIFAAHDEIKTVGDRIGSMVQLIDSPDVLPMAHLVRSWKPQTIISARLALQPATADRIIDLSRNGIKVFQLCADVNGRERFGDGRHIKDALREIHGRLVTCGLRDEITVIVSGGIALAEHMAKAIICGSDLVAVDTAMLIALGCRVCRQCDSKSRTGDSKLNLESGISNPEFDCPIQGGDLETEYAAQRMINLMGAWHSQLIEVLGAMGIREVRRLRGEMGRAIFMEEIEKEAFGDLLRIPSEEASA